MNFVNYCPSTLQCKIFRKIGRIFFSTFKMSQLDKYQIFTHIYTIITWADILTGDIQSCCYCLQLFKLMLWCSFRRLLYNNGWALYSSISLLTFATSYSILSATLRFLEAFASAIMSIISKERVNRLVNCRNFIGHTCR